MSPGVMDSSRLALKLLPLTLRGLFPSSKRALKVIKRFFILDCLSVKHFCMLHLAICKKRPSQNRKSRAAAITVLLPFELCESLIVL
jgi:hypothetical protein